jgi:hypothetical protein
MELFRAPVVNGPYVAFVDAKNILRVVAEKMRYSNYGVGFFYRAISENPEKKPCAPWNFKMPVMVGQRQRMQRRYVLARGNGFEGKFKSMADIHILMLEDVRQHKAIIKHTQKRLMRRLEGLGASLFKGKFLFVRLQNAERVALAGADDFGNDVVDIPAGAAFHIISHVQEDFHIV